MHKITMSSSTTVGSSQCDKNEGWLTVCEMSKIMMQGYEQLHDPKS